MQPHPSYSPVCWSSRYLRFTQSVCHMHQSVWLYIVGGLISGIHLNTCRTSKTAMTWFTLDVLLSSSTIGGHWECMHFWLFSELFALATCCFVPVCCQRVLCIHDVPVLEKSWTKNLLSWRSIFIQSPWPSDLCWRLNSCQGRNLCWDFCSTCTFCPTGLWVHCWWGIRWWGRLGEDWPLTPYTVMKAACVFCLGMFEQNRKSGF